MQKLFIMRHGEALFDAPDAQRALSERGHHQAAETAQWLLAQVKDKSVRVLASPFRRAQQTAQYIADAMAVSIESQPWLMPDIAITDVMAAWDALWMQADDDQCWILVSHMPLVGRLGRYLVDGERLAEEFFTTAEAVSYEADVWASGCAHCRTRYRPQA